MNFERLDGYIFLKNDFLPSKSAKIHVLSHSLHFSSAVFEGIRVYDSQAFFIDDHIERLEYSCSLMGLDLPYSKSEITEICKTLIKKNALNEGYLRPLVFKDGNSMAPENLDCKSILSVSGWKWERLFQKNVSLMISRWKKPNSKIAPVGAKSSGSYQTATLSKNEAIKKNYDDVLMLDIDDNIAESSACNIFWIKNNKVFTPDESSILNGITRQIVIKILKKESIDFEIGSFKIQNIFDAEDVFLTGTASEIINVNNIEKKKYLCHDISKIVKEKFDLLKIKKYEI